MTHVSRGRHTATYQESFPQGIDMAYSATMWDTIRHVRPPLTRLDHMEPLFGIQWKLTDW